MRLFSIALLFYSCKVDPFSSFLWRSAFSFVFSSWSFYIDAWKSFIFRAFSFTSSSRLLIRLFPSLTSFLSSSLFIIRLSTCCLKAKNSFLSVLLLSDAYFFVSPSSSEISFTFCWFIMCYNFNFSLVSLDTSLVLESSFLSISMICSLKILLDFFNPSNSLLRPSR